MSECHCICDTRDVPFDGLSFEIDGISVGEFAGYATIELGMGNGPSVADITLDGWKKHVPTHLSLHHTHPLFAILSQQIQRVYRDQLEEAAAELRYELDQREQMPSPYRAA